MEGSTVVIHGILPFLTFSNPENQLLSSSWCRKAFTSHTHVGSAGLLYHPFNRV